MARPRAKPRRRPQPSATLTAATPLVDRHALAITALAVLVRIPNLAWGLPDLDEEALPMKKALDMWGWARGSLDLDPHTAGWPSLSFYVHLLYQHVQFWLGRVVGAYGDRNDFLIAAWLDRGNLLLAARLLSVGAAAAIVWVAARVAGRLAGARGAWLAGGLLALSPLLVQYSQLVTPDILAALFATLAVSRIIAIHQSGQWRDAIWAGVWIGLGVSSKYTPLLLAPGVFAAEALRRPRSMLRAWASLGVAAITFALTSPFVALHPAQLARDVASQSLHMTLGHFGQGALPSGLFYLVGVLGPGLGWGGLALAVTGLAWAALQLRGVWLVLLFCILPYYVGLGALRAQFPRYALPLLMPIALGLAGLVAVLRTRKPDGEGAGRARVWSFGIAAVALLPAMVGLWDYHPRQARSDARQLANRHLAQASTGSQPYLAAENLSITLPGSRAIDTLDPELVARLTPVQRQRLRERPTYNIDYLPMYTVQPERAAFYYDLRHYLPYEYVVTSQAVRGRYLADSTRFAPQARFYRDLERYAALERRFGPDEGAGGPEIRIYRMTPAGRAALLRERGELDLAAAVRAGAPFHAPDFLTFVEGVARAAMARQDWSTAASYYAVLLEAGRREGMSSQALSALERLVAELRARRAAPAPR